MQRCGQIYYPRRSWDRSIFESQSKIMDRSVSSFVVEPEQIHFSGGTGGSFTFESQSA